MTFGITPLYCYAISSKRYALFNLAANGEPILRKASAHGLGDKRPPYDDDHAPASIPKPIVKLSDIGVDRWQYDLWRQIIKAALAGRFDAVPLDYHPALQLPAMSRYAATTPDILNWFKTHNADRPYASQVKPFNFLSAFQGTSCFDGSFIDEIEPTATARRPKGGKQTLRPIAPYSRDPVEAAKACFDRETGQPIPAARLKTYIIVLFEHIGQREDRDVQPLRQRREAGAVEGAYRKKPRRSFLANSINASAIPSCVKPSWLKRSCATMKWPWLSRWGEPSDCLT
jgi:hypothetical protein